MLFIKSAEKEERQYSTSYLGKIMFLIGIALMLSAGVFAQTEPNGGGEGDPDAPFDGGISLLVGAGVAYGVKQWRDSKRNNKEETNPEIDK